MTWIVWYVEFDGTTSSQVVKHKVVSAGDAASAISYAGIAYGSVFKVEKA